MRIVAKHYKTDKRPNTNTGEIRTYWVIVSDSPDEFIQINITKANASLLTKIQACQQSSNEFLIGVERRVFNGAEFYQITSEPSFLPVQKAA